MWSSMVWQGMCTSLGPCNGGIFIHDRRMGFLPARSLCGPGGSLRIIYTMVPQVVQITSIRFKEITLVTKFRNQLINQFSNHESIFKYESPVHFQTCTVCLKRNNFQLNKENQTQHLGQLLSSKSTYPDPILPTEIMEMGAR